PGRHVGMHRQQAATAEAVEGIKAVVLESRGMVGVQVAQRDAADPVEVEGNTGRLGRVAEQLAHRMRTFDEEPVVVQAERQAGRVVACCECFPYPQWYQADFAHRASR